MIDWLAGILLLLGGLFMAIAALGVYRMPDLYMRMSSSTKASTFGAVLLLGGVSLVFLDPATTTKAIAVIHGFKPGGGSDQLAQLTGPFLEKVMKQQCLLNNCQNKVHWLPDVCWSTLLVR